MIIFYSFTNRNYVKKSDVKQILPSHLRSSSYLVLNMSIVVRRCVRACMCVCPPICCVVCIIWCAAPHSLLSAIDRPNSQSGADCRIIVTLTYRVPGGWCRLSLEPGGRVIGIYQRWTERRACFVQPEREREREREKERERERESERDEMRGREGRELEMKKLGRAGNNDTSASIFSEKWFSTVISARRHPVYTPNPAQYIVKRVVEGSIS